MLGGTCFLVPARFHDMKLTMGKQRVTQKLLHQIQPECPIMELNIGEFV
jgi:hypothetical protein